jgi:hypothetical protein
VKHTLYSKRGETDVKGRLNNMMREDMRCALLAHAYDARQDALRAEGIELRNEAIRKLLTPAQIKAVETLLPLCFNEDHSRDTSVDWGGRVAVNCGGPKIFVGTTNFKSDYYEQYRPIEGSLPILTSMGDLRLDLPADDDLAVRVQSWADRCVELNSERNVSSEQIKAALAAFSTVSAMQASWPEVMPVVQDIIVEHLGRPAPSLPAVVITEMNAKLGLPPSNDDGERADAIAA